MEVNGGRPYNRRGQPIKKVRIYNRKKSQKPAALKSTSRQYDFLKWIRVVFKWGTAHSGLSRPELELLLHLYGYGLFTKYQFFDYYRTIGLTSKAKWDMYIQEGWIKQWRSSGRNMKGLFDLTSKGKIVCSKMHQMCVGDMDMPVYRKSNPLNKRKDILINKYYTNLFNKMNDERAKNKEEGN